MILFDAIGGVYGVEAGSPYMQQRDVLLDARFPVNSIDPFSTPLIANGIRPSDYAVCASIADTHLMGYETFLVTDVDTDTAELVPLPLYLEYFDIFADVALTRKLQAAPKFVEMLGLRGLTNQLAKRYPLYLR